MSLLSLKSPGPNPNGAANGIATAASSASGTVMETSSVRDPKMSEAPGTIGSVEGGVMEGEFSNEF